MRPAGLHGDPALARQRRHGYARLGHGRAQCGPARQPLANLAEALRDRRRGRQPAIARGAVRAGRRRESPSPRRCRHRARHEGEPAITGTIDERSAEPREGPPRVLLASGAALPAGDVDVEPARRRHIQARGQDKAGWSTTAERRRPGRQDSAHGCHHRARRQRFLRIGSDIKGTANDANFKQYKFEIGAGPAGHRLALQRGRDLRRARWTTRCWAASPRATACRRCASPSRTRRTTRRRSRGVVMVDTTPPVRGGTRRKGPEPPGRGAHLDREHRSRPRRLLRLLRRRPHHRHAGSATNALYGRRRCGRRPPYAVSAVDGATRARAQPTSLRA